MPPRLRLFAAAVAIFVLQALPVLADPLGSTATQTAPPPPPSFQQNVDDLLAPIIAICVCVFVFMHMIGKGHHAHKSALWIVGILFVLGWVFSQL